MAALDQHAIGAAAALLWSHRTAATRIPELPAHCRPANRSDGYAIQDAVAARSGQRVVGWKIAATSLVGQAHIGVDGPLAGSLLDDHVLAGDAASSVRVSLHGNLMRVAEAEFAFRFGRPLPARDQVYGVPEVLDAVESLHPTIEIPDSRYDNFATVGAPQLIADSACACWLVVGDATRADWRGEDLATHTVNTFLNGTPAAVGVGANVLRDPRLALTWLVNEVRTYGQGLQAGDLVTTGTCITPVSIAPGDSFRVDFGEFGSLAVELGRA
jgi:2-keto-4-pentenoate hydratase